MNSWEEIDFIIELLKQDTELEIQPNTSNIKVGSVAVQVGIFYSTSINEYLMVVHPEGNEITVEKINNFTNLKVIPVHSMIISSIYPINISQLSPLNVIDSRCRRMCSVLLFSQSFHGSVIKVRLTHSDSILEISFEDLQTVLKVAGAKVLQY
jgi:hypothetical protein